MLLFSQVEENPKGKATRRRKPKPISQRHRKGPKGENIRQKRSVTFLSQTEGPQAALKKMAESRFSMVLHRVLVRNGPEPGMHLPKEQARAVGLHGRVAGFTYVEGAVLTRMRDLCAGACPEVAYIALAFWIGWNQR